MFAATGRTITKGDPDTALPVMQDHNIVPRAQRKVIVFATSKITEKSIFTNGLFQNIYFLYKLAEIIGYTPFLLFNDRDVPDSLPDFMKSIRTLIISDLIKTPIPIYKYIEIGMSIDPDMRKYLKTLGARVIKLYLGNILNIDIETPTYYINQNFAHHIVGEADEIWVSPHYEMHREYAAVLNHVRPDSATNKIAAYVWDPMFITRFGSLAPKWIPRGPSEPVQILIMEPNISFQKASIIPLLICEALAQTNPSLKLDIKVVNGQRLQNIGYAYECFLPRLKIFRDGCIEFCERTDMRTAMAKYPSAIPICHNYNNEYNYMQFEFMYAGYPLIHNSPSWKHAGYYYNEETIEEGLAALLKAINNHEDNFDIYMGQAKTLMHRYSIYNPKVQEAWIKLLE
jgi:hypothetical protein